MNNVVKLQPPSRRTVVVTIEDLGGKFSLKAEGRGFDDGELDSYLRTAFSSWCRAQQDKDWEVRKVELNAEIDALPWYRRIFKQRFT